MKIDKPTTYTPLSKKSLRRRNEAIRKRCSTFFVSEVNRGDELAADEANRRSIEVYQRSHTATQKKA